MKKNLLLSFLMAFFTFQAFSGAAMAKQDIPEANGTYNVPGKPDMKVRVFVHYPKVKTAPSAQCNIGDEDSGEIVGSAGWRLPAGDWKYYVNSASAPSSIGSLNFKNFTDLSFAVWQNTDLKAAGINLKNAGSTSLSRKAQDGKNIVTFGSAPGGALGVTYTWYYSASGVAVETDTILNKKFTWGWTPYPPLTVCPNPDIYDAQNILTHEIGHWVGLNDHYTAAYANNTMYGYGSKGEIKKDTLTAGDISGVNKIY